jgi:hypothetical protein
MSNLVWAKRGRLKLGPNNFVDMEVGDEIPGEVLSVLGNAVPQLVKDGQIKDVSDELAEAAKRKAEAVEKAKKAIAEKVKK